MARWFWLARQGGADRTLAHQRAQLLQVRHAAAPRSGPHLFSPEADKKDGRLGPSTSPSAGARHRAGVGRRACGGLAGALDPAPGVLPKQVGDPLLPLQIGIRDALLALLRP